MLGDDDTLLGKNAGCNLISIAFLVLMGGYAIYWFARGGDPANKKFFDDCYRRETRQYMPGYVPDFAMRSAIAECTNQQRKALGMPDLNMKALP